MCSSFGEQGRERAVQECSCDYYLPTPHSRTAVLQKSGNVKLVSSNHQRGLKASASVGLGELRKASLGQVGSRKVCQNNYTSKACYRKRSLCCQKSSFSVISCTGSASERRRIAESIVMLLLLWLLYRFCRDRNVTPSSPPPNKSYFNHCLCYAHKGLSQRRRYRRQWALDQVLLQYPVFVSFTICAQ